MKQYLNLLLSILYDGVEKESGRANMPNTIGLSFGNIQMDLKDGFPLLTTKKMYWKGIATELIWFLRGDTNIKFLVDNNCHIWDGDAYKNYISKGGKDFSEKSMKQISSHFSQEEFINKIKTDDEFAKKWGDLGPVYGKQWRNWNRITYNDEHRGGFHNPIDQIQNLINDLKTNPDSRRLMVNTWNVGELDLMTLPPCHYGFQVYTRELSNKERIILMNKKLGVTDTLPQYYNTDDEMDKNNIPTRAISLMWNQRSVDTFIGLPFNIASYGLLLEILAKMTNMIPDELIGNLGDVHLYEDHMSQAREQLVREPYVLPKLKINAKYWVDDCGLDTHILSMLIEDFQIENYQSHPTIKAPLIN